MFHVAATSATRPLEPISKAWRVSAPSPHGRRNTKSKELDKRGGSHIPDRSDARRRPELGGLDVPPASERSPGSLERGIAEPAGKLLPQNSLCEVMRYKGAAQPREHRMRSMTSSGSRARRTLESASSRFVRASLSRLMVSRRSSPAHLCFNARLSKSPACTNGEPYAAAQWAIRRSRSAAVAIDSAASSPIARARSLCMRLRMTQQLGSEMRSISDSVRAACVFPPEPARQGVEREANGQ